MRNVSLRAALALAALLAAAPAFATNGMRMIGYGPVQNSMGGVSTAAPLDATTVITNPAGMSALDRRLDLSGTAFMPSPEYQASGAASNATIESDRPTDFMPTVAAIYRTSDALTLGVAALGTAGMGVDYAADLYGSRTKTSYAAMRVAPAVAYRLSERLSVGAAANLMYAQMQYNVGGAMGMVPRDPTGSFGIGATFGLTWQTPEDVTIGIAYETKSWFQDFEFDVPSHTVLTPMGAMTVPGGTEALDLDQPDILTLGAGFRPMEPLLVAVDLQWIRWSGTMGKGLPAFQTDPNLTGATAWDMDWSDQLVFKLGAQYDVTRELKVRAGYNWGDSPLHATRAFENVAFPAIAQHHFTVGGGYDVGPFTVNASVMYSPEATLAGSNPAQGIASYETRMSQLAFDLGASWRY